MSFRTSSENASVSLNEAALVDPSAVGRLPHRWFPRLDPRDPLLRPALRMMDGIFRFGLLILASLGAIAQCVNVLLTVVSKNKPLAEAFIDFRHSVLWLVITQHIFIDSCLLATALFFAIVCWRAHVAMTWDKSVDPFRGEYVLERVKRLDPTRFIYRYLPPKTYLERPADANARWMLKTLDKGKHKGQYRYDGICIVGVPALGKSRLAWEAMQYELKDRLLIKWPHPSSRQQPPPLRYLQGQSVVVWLDNLQDYINEADINELSTLPQQLAASHVDAILIATTWPTGLNPSARYYLKQDLMSRLYAITPEDITLDQARDLAKRFSQAPGQNNRNIDDYLNGWDHHTPGSVLLGPVTMCSDVFQHLPQEARYILWAMQAISSAKMRDFSIRRVRAVCNVLFHWPDQPNQDDRGWQSMLEILSQTKFVSPLNWGLDTAEIQIEDVYLVPGQGIPIYPLWYGDPTSAWTGLREAFISLEDYLGLISLGCQFFSDKERYSDAADCFRPVLEHYAGRLSKAYQAMAHNNLGSSLVEIVRAEMRSSDVRFRDQWKQLLIDAEEHCDVAFDLYNQLADQDKISEDGGSSLRSKWHSLAQRARMNAQDARKVREGIM